MLKILHLNKLQKNATVGCICATIDEKTIPKNNYETLFAQDFSGSSGDLQTDNNAVTFYLPLTRSRG